MALLVLLSAFLHALWNALLKREREAEPAAAVVLLVALALSAVFVVAPFWPGLPRGEALGWAILAGLLEGVYFLVLIRALTAAPLGVAYAVSRGVAILLVWPLSALFLGERVTAAAVAGALLVVAGLASVGLGKKSGLRLPSGTGWAIATGGCIAVYHLSYKRALALGAPGPGVILVSLAIAAAAQLLRLRRGGRRRLRVLLAERPAVPVLAGLVCGASFLIFLVALRQGGAGAIITLRNTSVVFAQLLALALGERPGARGFAGSVLIVLGAALVTGAL